MGRNRNTGETIPKVKSSWILMIRATSGWFHNSYFWLAPETPMQKHFHAALKCCACPSDRSSTAFSIQARAPKACSYLHKAVMPNSGIFQNALEEASLQSGSLNELYRVCVKSNASRKALWEVIFLWHTCLLDVSCHLGLFWAFACSGKCVALCKGKWHQLTTFKVAALV